MSKNTSFSELLIVFRRNRSSWEKKKKEPLAPALSPAWKTFSWFLTTLSESSSYLIVILSISRIMSNFSCCSALTTHLNWTFLPEDADAPNYNGSRSSSLIEAVLWNFYDSWSKWLPLKFNASRSIIFLSLFLKGSVSNSSTDSKASLPPVNYLSNTTIDLLLEALRLIDSTIIWIFWHSKVALKEAMDDLVFILTFLLSSAYLEIALFFDLVSY